MNGRIKREVENIRIPIIGKIKCGMKNDKGLPQSLDYFIADGNYKAMFNKEFGEKPKNIEIIFLSDNFEDVCNERMEIRQGTKLFAWGDGETFEVYSKAIDDYSTFTIKERPKLLEECEQRSGGKWDATLTLRFLIPRIRGVFGVWQLTTKGENSSIPQIVSVFDKVKQIAGTVMNIPFDLSVDKVKSQKPESKSSFPVIRLIPNISQESLDTVRNFIESGKTFHGLLTDDRIEALKSIPVIPENIEKAIEADFELKLEEQ
jgi:hypothetical protein